MKFKITLQTRRVTDSSLIKVEGTLDLSEMDIYGVPVEDDELGELGLMLEVQANSSGDRYVGEVFNRVYNKWPLRVWVERSK